MLRKIAASTVLLGLLPLLAAALTIDDSDLLLYYPVTDDANVLDKGPGGNDGVIDGTVRIVAGKYGHALEFIGQGDVRAPYIPLNRAGGVKYSV